MLLGTETILIVEDEQAVRKLTERILASAGYHVLAASNGPEAKRLCEGLGSELHLVLTDVVMPQMSGKELVDQLTQSCKSMKVLYMSGYANDAIGLHGILDEGTHFIAKPFSKRELLEKVRRVLDIA